MSRWKNIAATSSSELSKQADGNQTKAADRLRLQRTYLARLIKQQKVKEEPD